MRLTSTVRGSEHHVTIPAHDALKVGTLAAIPSDVAGSLEIERDELAKHLFGR